MKEREVERERERREMKRKRRELEMTWSKEREEEVGESIRYESRSIFIKGIVRTLEGSCQHAKGIGSVVTLHHDSFRGGEGTATSSCVWVFVFCVKEKRCVDVYL